MTSISAVAAEYFSTLNPLAEKIQRDIDEIKLSYENAWETLSERERNEIIDYSLIPSQLSLCYTPLSESVLDLATGGQQSPLERLFVRPRGQRLVQYEGTEYRDEHSAPFSFHSASQLDLCVLNERERHKEEEKPPPPAVSELVLSHSAVVSELKTALRGDRRRERDAVSPTSFIAKMMSKRNKGRGEEHELLVLPEAPVAEVARGGDSPRGARDGDWCSESRQLLDSRESSQSSRAELSTVLPRTGYDFLDNW